MIIYIKMYPKSTHSYFSSILQSDLGGVYMNIDCARSFCSDLRYRGLSGIHLAVI